MKAVRISLAVVAASAAVALFAVFALAAPNAVSRTVAPNAGAAQAEYCPKGERARRVRALKAYQRQMVRNRKAFFRTHPRPAQRRAFVKKQKAQLRALQRAVARCN